MGATLIFRPFLYLLTTLITTIYPPASHREICSTNLSLDALVLSRLRSPSFLLQLSLSLSSFPSRAIHRSLRLLRMPVRFPKKPRIEEKPDFKAGESLLPSISSRKKEGEEGKESELTKLLLSPLLPPSLLLSPLLRLNFCRSRILGFHPSLQQRSPRWFRRRYPSSSGCPHLSNVPPLPPPSSLDRPFLHPPARSSHNPSNSSNTRSRRRSWDRKGDGIGVDSSARHGGDPRACPSFLKGGRESVAWVERVEGGGRRKTRGGSGREGG